MYELSFLEFRNTNWVFPWRTLETDATSSAWELPEQLKSDSLEYLTPKPEKKTNLAWNSSSETQELLHGGPSLWFGCNLLTLRASRTKLTWNINTELRTPRLRKRAWHCRVEEMLISTGSNLEALVSSNASPRVVHGQGHSFHARRIHPLLSEPEENISRLSVSKGTRRRSKSERAMEAPNPHLSVQNLQEFPTLGLLAAYLMSTPPSLLPGTIMHMAPLVNHVGQPHH